MVQGLKGKVPVEVEVKAEWAGLLQQGREVTAFAQIVDIKNHILSDNLVIRKYVKNAAQE